RIGGADRDRLRGGRVGERVADARARRRDEDEKNGDSRAHATPPSERSCQHKPRLGGTLVRPAPECPKRGAGASSRAATLPKDPTGERGRRAARRSPWARERAR